MTARWIFAFFLLVNPAFAEEGMWLRQVYDAGALADELEGARK